MANEQVSDNRRLMRFAFLTAAMTFFLVWVGGLVTSHEAGMAVPDWPNTFGYNMFFFPISKWMGGIFYEHTHRLIATVVGMLSTVLALWLNGNKSRPVLRWGGAALAVLGLVIWLSYPIYRGAGIQVGGAGAAFFVASFFWPACAPASARLRKLGWLAFGLVVVQGVLGGLRVTQISPQLGIVHGTVAQLFFLLTACIAFALTQYWKRLPEGSDRDFGGFTLLVLLTTAAVVCQLVLGATMRHQHAGLAIPDFPLAYGKIWPPTDAQSIASYNQSRIEVQGYEPITAFQVWLQMVHRIAACGILIAVIVVARKAVRQFGSRHRLSRWALAWLGIVIAQVCLGATTIWTGKSADIATLHVAFGALTLLVGGFLTMIATRTLAAAPGAGEVNGAIPKMPASA